MGSALFSVANCEANQHGFTLQAEDGGARQPSNEWYKVIAPLCAQGNPKTVLYAEKPNYPFLLAAVVALLLALWLAFSKLG